MVVGAVLDGEEQLSVVGSSSWCQGAVLGVGEEFSAPPPARAPGAQAS